MPLSVASAELFPSNCPPNHSKECPLSIPFQKTRVSLGQGLLCVRLAVTVEVTSKLDFLGTPHLCISLEGEAGGPYGLHR